RGLRRRLQGGSHPRGHWGWRHSGFPSGNRCDRWRGNSNRIIIPVNAPEIVYRFEEFDFNISLYARQVTPAHNSADHVTSTRIRKDDRLSDRQIIRAAKNRPIVEHNDGPSVFPNRLGQAACFGWQTSDGDGNFQTDGIGTRGLAGLVLRILGRRTRLARAVQVRGVFDRKRHGIPIMNGPTHRGLRAPSECRYSRLCNGTLAIVRGYYNA